MKSIPRTVAATLLLFFCAITTSVAGTLTNASASGDNPKVCGENNYFTMTLIPSAPCTVYIEFSPSMPSSCNERPFVMRANPVPPEFSYNSTLHRYEIILSTLATYTLNWYFDIDCSLLDLVDPLNPQPITVYQIVSSSDGESWNGSSPLSIPHTVDVFSIVPISTTLNIQTQLDEDVPIEFQYAVPGNTSAKVALKFSLENNPCHRFDVVGNTFDLEYSLSSNVMQQTGLAFDNYQIIELDNTGPLKFRMTVHIVGCECEDPDDDWNVKLEYVCAANVSADPNDFCAPAEHCQDAVTLNFSLPDYLNIVRQIKVERPLPQNLWQEEAAQCFGDELQWTYKITNVGAVPVSILNLRLHDYAAAPGSLAKIKEGEPSVTCTNFTGTIQCIPSEPCSTVSNTPNCFGGGYAGISEYNYQVLNVPLGGEVLLTFKTKLCCLTDEATYMNSGKFINDWVLQVQGIDECGDENFTNILFPTTLDQLPYHGNGYISYYGRDDVNVAYEDLHQIINYSPVLTDMDDGSIGDIDMNYGFSSPKLPDPLTVSSTSFDWDYHLFFPLNPSLPVNNQLLPYGILKVVIETDQGLQVYDATNPTNAIEIVQDFLQEPYAIHPLQDCYNIQTIAGPPQSPCNLPGTSFEYYFDLGDQIGQLVAQNLPIFVNYNFTPVQILNQFLQSGQLKFKLRASCEACQPRAYYNVKFYLAPKNPGPDCGTYDCSSDLTAVGGAFCWIPLSSKDGSIIVHCPGCVTPGIITHSDRLIRTTLGYQDSENDALLDGPPVPIDDNYAHYNQMNLTSSFMGDKLESTLTAHFEDGSTANDGWTYSMMGNLLHWLYLEKTFPFSGPSWFDVQCASAQLIVYPDQLSLQNNTGQIASVSFAAPDANHIMYDASNQIFNLRIKDDDLGTGFLFQPWQWYKLIMDFKVCGNYFPASLNAPQSEYIKNALVTNELYLIGSEQPGWPNSVPSYPWALPEPNPQWPSYADNHRFVCEGRSTMHTLYSVDARNARGEWFSNPCDPMSRPQAYVRVGGGVERPFNYEFRPNPIWLTDYKITRPDGSNVHYGAGLSPEVRSYYRYYNAFGNPIVTNIGPVVYSPNNLPLPDPFHFDVPGQIASYYPADINPLPLTNLPVGEEIFNQIHQVRYEHTCASTAMVLDQTDYTATFEHLDCDNTLVSEEVYANQGMTDAIPNPNLSLTFYPASVLQNVGTNTVCWKFIIQNNTVNSEEAENIFFYIVESEAMDLSNWHLYELTDCDQQQTEIPLTYGIYHLVDLLPVGQHRCFLMCADLTSCSTPESFHVHWGWDCRGYPYVDNQTQMCFYQSRKLTYNLANADVNPDGYQVDPDAFYCEPFDVKVCFKNIAAGDVTLDDAGIALRISGLSPAAILQGVWINNPLTGVEEPLPFTPSGPDYVCTVTQAQMINLFPPSGYFTTDRDICVRLSLNVTCTLNPDEINLPVVTAWFRSFCGAVIEKFEEPDVTPISVTDAGYCSLPVCSLGFRPRVTSQVCTYTFVPINLPCGEPTYYWDFGDGNYSTDASPIHTYQYDGTYTVCLTVTCENGQCCTHCEDVVVERCSNPPCSAVAEFSSDVEKCQTLNFTNLSTACDPPLTSVYVWTFGDNNWSAAFSPTHMYSDPGNYQVCLRIDCYDYSNGNDDFVCEDITCHWVLTCPCSQQHAAFDYDVSAANCSLVTFTNYSVACSNTTHYFWDFGDNTTSISSAINVPHQYPPGPATYTACLIVSCYNGNDLECQSMFCYPIRIQSCRTGGQSGTDPGDLVALIVPNPASIDNVNLHIESAVSGIAGVNILNPLGEKVLETHFQLTRGNNENGLNIQALGPGIYYVKIVLGDLQKTIRFCVVK